MKVKIGTILRILALGQSASNELINGGMTVAGQVNLGLDLQRALINLAVEIGEADLQIENHAENVYSIQKEAA